MARREGLLAAGAFVLLVSSGCASAFTRIYPGMSRSEVNQVMARAPDRAQEFTDGSEAWYYGEDQCVRFREDRVVEKQESQTRTAVATPWFTAHDVQKALCAPPGEQQAASELTISTPMGVIQAPVPAQPHPHGPQGEAPAQTPDAGGQGL